MDEILVAYMDAIIEADTYDPHPFSDRISISPLHLSKPIEYKGRKFKLYYESCTTPFDFGLGVWVLQMLKEETHE